jgi:hypothetical protein
LLQVSPDSSPQPWFLNSAANYNLGNIPQAEKGIVRGLHLDTKHQIVQMEYLYGLILAAKKDYKAAADHVSTYVRLAPNSKEVERTRKVLADLQQKAQVAEPTKP